MAIQNVRYEPTASNVPLPTLNLKTIEYLEALISDGALPAVAPFVNITPTDPLWDFEIQASARNVRPVYLLLTIEARGVETISSVELSPGGSYSYKVADLSMMSAFKTQDDVLDSGVYVTKIEIDKGRTDLFPSGDGRVTVELTGTTVSY